MIFKMILLLIAFLIGLVLVVLCFKEKKPIIYKTRPIMFDADWDTTKQKWVK